MIRRGDDTSDMKDDIDELIVTLKAWLSDNE